MRNLIGYLKRIPLLFSLLITFLFLVTTNTYAEENFSISADFAHSIIDTNINTEAIVTISSDTTRVVSYLTTTIPQQNLSVECYNAISGKKLDCSSHKQSGATDILIDFNNAVVKPNAPLKLKLIYSTSTNQLDALNIVSTIQDATTNSITITYPKTLGEPLWTSDAIQNIKSIGDSYQITILKPIYPNISVLFGKNISYKFSISKTFTNSLADQNQTFELIVPSDTTTQLLIWDDITPLPNIAEQDEDGNYILKYIVAPGDTLDCNIQGHIIMRKAITDENVPGSFLTTKSGYWQSTQKFEFSRILTYLKDKNIKIPDTFSSIKEVDESNQELIYKYLYQYTIERLNPQKDLTKGIVTDNRIGFDQLVSNPNESTPSDYTDFLIAILREYGIPSRQVIGFVSNISGYTSDGFYNYWVEAYNFTQKKWIIMDPFLEDYSGKSLYGNVFYDHISILKRGKSPVAPKLTFYKDTDFLVTLSSQEEIVPNFALEAQLVFENNNTISEFLTGLINVSNTGNIAISKYSINSSNITDIRRYVDPVNNINSQVILPKQNATLQLNIPNSLSTSNISVNIKFSNQDFSKDMPLESAIKTRVPLYLDILTKAISLLSFAGIIYLVYFLLGKVKIKRHE